MQTKKICLITGGSSGIGKAAAEKFAYGAGKLILAGRNRHRGEKVVEDLKRRSGNDNIFFFSVDLSSLKEIRSFSGQVHDCCERIDVLVNNAGASFSKYHLTIDSIEATFAVNYLSRFLLTNLLLDLIRNSSSGRIINVTGEYYRKGDKKFKMIDSSGYSAIQAAGNAKLADMVFTMELARRLKDLHVTVNAMHPGTVATDIIYNDPDASVLKKFLYTVVKKIFRDAGKAGEDIYHLAFAEELKNTTGKYFNKRKITEPMDLVYDKDIAERLWEYSENISRYKNNFFAKKTILDN